MASTRSPSPASDAGSNEPLSPRAKINAMLAGLDSSDDENGNSGTQVRPTARPASTRSPPKATSDSEDDDEESDVEIRPRGRLAARMLGVAPTTDNTASNKAASPAPQENDDEDNDLPVAPRRLQRKPVQQDEESQPARSPSPGLFVSSPVRLSPSKQPQQADANDTEADDDEIVPATKSDRFKALVERKKQERLAREAAEEARKAERRAQQEKLSSEMDGLVSEDDIDPSDIDDDEGGIKLTQGTGRRTTARKASKKAIEEMNRETQRMQRSMQLAHEARTRKKISKNSLFERFNFRPAGQPEPKTASSSLPGSPPSDDVEMKDSDTPPSSPPDDAAKKTDNDTVTELPQQQEQQQPALDKSKGKDIAPATTTTSPKPTKRRVRVKMPPLSVNHVTVGSDDELELEITRATTKDKIDAIFDRLPAKKDGEAHSLEALRALAQVRSPGKETRRKDEHTGMTIGQLQAYLHQKAKQQAKLERDRRLDMLKAQGVVVQTAEERERQMQEVEDIVAKARAEAQQIMEQERAAAKKNKGEDGAAADPLAWDDSEDEDYEDPANEADGEAEIELSGSEDEEGEEGDDEEEEEEEAQDSAMIDAAAEEDDAEDEAEDDNDLPANRRRRSRKQVAVLSDDEGEGEQEANKVEATPNPKAAAKTQASPAIAAGATTPGSVLRSAKKTFIPGLPVQGAAGLGLTQIFAGTMEDSQMSPTNQNQNMPTQSLMPDFDHFPDSNFSATAGEAVDDPLPATQAGDETQGGAIQLNMDPATQVHGLDSLMRDDGVPATQLSEFVEPSQDGGFQERTPLKERFVDAPHSTVDTVVLSGRPGEQSQQQPQDSPLVRRGRLRRKMESMVPEDDDEDEDSNVIKSSLPPPAPESAFGAMQDAARKEERLRRKQAAVDEFNRKKSKAKDMVEELAEESEDEYQGLGGYDGEDSDDESNASVKDMIDDAAGNDADERKLAAFYADRERANDEKQVEQLFKDITNGMLRRKRGADYDLSDSDDDGEARKKMKRRQFAKMQKALFADERVKKMAENPGNQAFLKTIEDQGSDDEMNILDGVQEEEPSQSQSETKSADEQPRQQVVPDSQPRGESSGSGRLPARQRRTANGRKPANIGEVRETLSNLLEDERFGSVVPATEDGSDNSDNDGDDDENRPDDKENQAPAAGNPRRGGIVDRLSLKRNGSSSSSSSSRMARAAAAAGQGGSSSSFKVPALLRRATTNSLMSTSSTASSTAAGASATTASAGFGDDAKIKKVASKGSGVNAFGAAAKAGGGDGRARLQESERRREERKVRGAERRAGMVGGLLSKGSFQ